MTKNLLVLLQVQRPPFVTDIFNAGGPAYYVLHPQKGITIYLFWTYQAFRNREGIISRKNFTEGLQI